MKIQKTAVLLASSLFVSSAAFALTPEEVQKTLHEKYPNTNITTVRPSPLNGLYEVIMGKNIAYTDESGRYMLFGHIFDMEKQRDLTADALDDLNKVDVAQLPIKNSIVRVNGNGQRKIWLFSDPDCPFCKRLEQELSKIKNVTIYTFLFPLESLHPEARAHATAIWCAKDKAKAWDEFMRQGKLPESKSCDTPIEENLALGESLGINGTPTLFFEDGSRASGAMPAEQIEAKLNQIYGNK